MSLWFVTPAWQRFELSAVCFDQRAAVIEALAAAGIEAHCVVVADDANLDLARERGFAVVERNNDWLGRKFNDGMEYAGKHGAEWIVPIGSDSWIHPDYFLPLTDPTATRTSPAYAVVTADRMAELQVGGHGAGPYVFHRSLLAPSRFRPAADQLRKNIDHSTIKGIRRPVRWQPRTVDPLQYIGFRGVPHITSYARLLDKWGVAERDDPWERLATVYPVDLVERARAVMQGLAPVV